MEDIRFRQLIRQDSDAAIGIAYETSARCVYIGVGSRGYQIDKPLESLQPGDGPTFSSDEVYWGDILTINKTNFKPYRLLRQKFSQTAKSAAS